MNKDTKTEQKPPEKKTEEVKKPEETKEIKETKKEYKLDDIEVYMKKGDYQVHVLVEEVRELKGKDKDREVSPVVKVTCLGKCLRTKKLKFDIKTHVFDEHFFFDKNNLNQEELDSEKIIIEVYDHHHSKKVDYLGIYECDFHYIYKEKNHALNNFWIALANPESSDITLVRGFLKVSISVLHEEDTRVDLVMKTASDNNDMCIIPPQIKMEYKQLKIYIHAAREIPDMDYIFSANHRNKAQCDGFVKVEYMGSSVSSKVVKMVKSEIIWNQCLMIAVVYPVISTKLLFSLLDKDTGRDDIVGSFEINVNDILKGNYEKFSSINLYGPPVGCTGEYTDKMLKNPEIGSMWRGYIVLKIDGVSTDVPSLLAEDIKDKAIKAKAIDSKRCINWKFDIQYYSIYFLPDNDNEYGLKIMCGERPTIVPKRKPKNKTICINASDSLDVSTYKDTIDDVPDVLIYLVKNDINICFQRIKASEFLNNNDILVIKLFPDPALNKINDIINSGLIKIRITLKGPIGFSILSKPKEPQQPVQPTKQITPPIETKPTKKKDNLEDDSDDEPVKTKAEIQIKQEQALIDANTNKHSKEMDLYTIVANVHQSKELISMDKSGTNDPYVKITIEGITCKSSIKQKTVNAIWNEYLVFENIPIEDINDKRTWPIGLLEIKDKDIVGSEFLGYSYIWISDCKYAINEVKLVQPDYVYLYLPKSNKRQGQILLSFLLINQKTHKHLIDNDLPKYSIIPKCEPYSFEINILGLRGLKPLSMLPVKKAYICFDLNSINVTGEDKKGNELRTIKTQPKQSGSSPTINTVVKIDISLPIDRVFMPDLQCVVYDYILNGMINTSLGVFIINLNKIIDETEKRMDEDLSITEKKVGLNLIKSINLEEISSIGLNKNLLPQNNSSINPLLDEKPIDNVQDEVINNNLKKLVENKEYNKMSDAEEIKLEIKDNINTPANKELSLEEMNKSINYVIKPVYTTYDLPGVKKDSKKYQAFEKEDRDKAPKDEYYKVIGWNKIKTDDKKHYRRFYGKELESYKDELGMRSPFMHLDIHRGKYSDNTEVGSFFDALRNIDSKIIKRYSSIGESKEKIVEQEEPVHDHYFGVFKGLIRICRKSKLEKYRETLSTVNEKAPYLLKDFKYHNKFNDLAKRILTEKEVFIRLYVLQLKALAKKDLISPSDPYVIVRLGKEVRNDNKSALVDKQECDWYKVYEFQTKFPGNGILEIEVWDQDPIFPDEMIGCTKIDLEDRYYNSEWREMVNKPIETRRLYHPDYEEVQGEMTMWVDIFDYVDKQAYNKIDITPSPVMDFEIRLIIWETEDIPMLDDEGTSDIYMAAVANNEKQSTDMHFRCQTGCGSFNWRILIPITFPNNDTQLAIQAYDNDFFSRDDFISSNFINIRCILEDCYDLDIPIKFNKDYFDDLVNKNKDKDKDKEKDKGMNKSYITFDDPKEKDKFWLDLLPKDGTNKGGRVLLSLEVLPRWKADVCKVGKGRDQPNINPYLPPPVGRFNWTLNPFSLLNQCVGPRYRRRIYVFCLAMCCIAYLVFVIPYVLLHLSGEAVNPFNYK